MITEHTLMERAAGEACSWLCQRYAPQLCCIVCGLGNNGGDGLALARQLAQKGWHILAVIIETGQAPSPCFLANRAKLDTVGNITLTEADAQGRIRIPKNCSLLIDALLGSGLNRPVSGALLHAINSINEFWGMRISIDLPSGMYAENNGKRTGAVIVRAHATLTFQAPKLGMLLADAGNNAGELHILDIGQDKDALQKTESPYHYLQMADIAPLMPHRQIFSHKGLFGHALIVAGSSGKLGAAILSARACIRSGCGLLTVHSIAGSAPVLLNAVPEAMTSCSHDGMFVSAIPYLGAFNAIAFGPGLGTNSATAELLANIFDAGKPTVIDADGLNLLALNPLLLERLPHGTILTPHLREFERMFGKCASAFERLQRQREMSIKLGVIIVLKGHYTSISSPEGKLAFNSTGNQGMASAGSGDALTGIIAALLSQGIPPLDAAQIGVFVHGLAGDIALKQSCDISLSASDIINCLPAAFAQVASKPHYQKPTTL